MGIYHATIPPVGTIGGVDQPQWAQAHIVDSGGITFADSTVQTTAYTGASANGYSAIAVSSGYSGTESGSGIAFLDCTLAGNATFTGMTGMVDKQTIVINNNASSSGNLTFGSSGTQPFEAPSGFTLLPGTAVYAVYYATPNLVYLVP
jgi:hypothetical protein